MVNGSGVAVRPDAVAVEFDDQRLVANAGVMLTGTLVDRLGLEREGAGNSIRPLSRRGLVFMNEASKHVSSSNQVESDDGL